LIEELAEYERLGDQVSGSAELLTEGLFGPRPVAEAVVAEIDSDLVGFAVFFSTFSTFLCRPGLWLEDLFVRPQHRGAGVGGALLAHVAGLAVARGCGRVEWSALDWNELALRFYDRVGAKQLDQWRILRLDGDALDHVAGSRSRR
jgi:GNAT superfamily N-acetyltransferase